MASKNPKLPYSAWTSAIEQVADDTGLDPYAPEQREAVIAAAVIIDRDWRRERFDVYDPGLIAEVGRPEKATYDEAV